MATTTEAEAARDRGAAAALGALCALSLPLLFYGLGSYSVVNGDEAFYHAVARNMVESGDWLRLEFTGEHRIYDTFMNAPLQYWARAVLITAFGDNAWTMRGLSAAFALASVLMTFQLARALGGVRAGFLAGLIQLTTYQFVYTHSARTGELEPMLCFGLTGVAYLFWRALEPGRGFWLHHLGVIALLNLKAPFAIVPILAELAYFAATPEARPRFGAWLRAGLLLPLGGVWHLGQLAALSDGGWGALDRMLTQMSGSGLDQPRSPGGNAIFYAATLLCGAFPYALAWPLAVAHLLVRPASDRTQAGVEVLLVFALAVFGFFVLVAKALPWYVDPMLPLLAALLGLWLERLRHEPLPAWAAAGVVAGAALWAGLELRLFDPFAVPARAVPVGRLAWREGALWMAPAAAAAAALALLALRRLRAPGADAWLSAALTAALLAGGAVRVVAPLGGVEHTSAMESLRAELDRRRAEGRPIAFPVPVTEPGKLRVRYWFGDDFRIVRAEDPAREGAYFYLVSEGRTPGDPGPAPTAAPPR